MSNGVLTRRTDELELYRVKDITLVEPFFLRLFGLEQHYCYDQRCVHAGLSRIPAIKGVRELREELRKMSKSAATKSACEWRNWNKPCHGYKLSANVNARGGHTRLSCCDSAGDEKTRPGSLRRWSRQQAGREQPWKSVTPFRVNVS